MAFWYSVRLSRRNVSVRPGSGCSAAARSSEPASAATIASYVAPVGRTAPVRRHLARDQPPDDLLPGLRVPAHVLRADGVEGQPRRLVLAVVAFDAVQVDEPADRLALFRAHRPQARAERRPELGPRADRWPRLPARGSAPPRGFA